MIEYLDPCGEPDLAAQGYTLTADLAPGTTIGLLANSFPGSAAFLDLVADGLSALVEGVRFERWTKDDLGLNASVLVPDATLDTIVSSCDALVTAYGH
jgi:hypothetical protein